MGESNGGREERRENRGVKVKKVEGVERRNKAGEVEAALRSVPAFLRCDAPAVRGDKGAKAVRLMVLYRIEQWSDTVLAAIAVAASSRLDN